MAQKHLDLPELLMERIEALRILLFASTGRKPSKSEITTQLILLGLDVVDHQPRPAEFFKSMAIAAKKKPPGGSDAIVAVAGARRKKDHD